MKSKNNVKAWPKVELGDLVEISSGGTPPRAKADLWGGDLPWITAKDMNTFDLNDSSQRLSISGASRSAVVPRDTVLVLVRGMRLFKDVPIGVTQKPMAFNQDIKALKSKGIVSARYIAHALRNQRHYLLGKVDQAGHGTGRLQTSVLEDLPIVIPSEDEQVWIVDALDTWDTAIAQAKAIVESKTRWILSLSEALMKPQKGWLKASLSEFTNEAGGRNKGALPRSRVMAVTKGVGLRPMRADTMADNIERYKIVAPRMFAYNPMRINIGSIAMSRFNEDVLVSPDYVVFECGAELLPEYLNYFRTTSAWQRYFDVAGNGGVRVRIYYEDLARFQLKIPSKKEQRKICLYLDAAANELAVLKLRLLALRKQKEGVMRHLFSGRWRMNGAGSTGRPRHA